MYKILFVLATLLSMQLSADQISNVAQSQQESKTVEQFISPTDTTLASSCHRHCVKGPTGPTGPTGPAGPSGPTGATGPTGASNLRGPGSGSYISAVLTSDTPVLMIDGSGVPFNPTPNVAKNIQLLGNVLFQFPGEPIIPAEGADFKVSFGVNHITSEGATGAEFTLFDPVHGLVIGSGSSVIVPVPFNDTAADPANAGGAETNNLIVHIPPNGQLELLLTTTPLGNTIELTPFFPSTNAEAAAFIEIVQVSPVGE